MDPRIKVLQEAYPDIDYMMAETIWKAYDRGVLTQHLEVGPDPSNPSPGLTEITIENKPRLAITECEEDKCQS